jgi:hypothetical protein
MSSVVKEKNFYAAIASNSRTVHAGAILHCRPENFASHVTRWLRPRPNSKIMVFQTSPSMPKRSKAAQSRANNLLRGRKVLQIQQDNARVIPDGLFPDWCQLRPASCDNSDHAQQPDSSEADDWAFDTETDNSFEWLDEESMTEIDSEEEQSDPRDSFSPT